MNKNNIDHLHKQYSVILCQELTSYISSLNNNSKVLDYGCGRGRTTREIIAHNSNTSVDMLDLPSVINLLKDPLFDSVNISKITQFPESNINYTNVICHRMIHSLTNDMLSLVMSNIASAGNNCSAFISARSTYDRKYQICINKPNIWTRNNNSFYKKLIDKNLTFYTSEALKSLCESYGMTISSYGEFTENSFTKEKTNHYCYVIVN